jgi:hypothetical protein
MIDPDGLVMLGPWDYFQKRYGRKPSRGKYNGQDWDFCRKKCGCMGVLRCVVRVTLKMDTIKPPVTGLSMNREVLCECADDEPLNFQIDEPLPWWWILVLFLIPPTGALG